MLRKASLLLTLLWYCCTIINAQHFLLDSGIIKFKSEAPLEIISAETNTYKAIIDTSTGEFAISVTIQNFVGFNSKLQQSHFYENYMEIDRYSASSFVGKILGPFGYTQSPTNITLKGTLDLHGMKKARIIEAKLTWLDRNTIKITSEFSIPLKDHGIEIPRVVHQKIAEVIKVDVSAILKAKT